MLLYNLWPVRIYNFFPTLCHKCYDLKKKLLNVKCAFWFLLSETFFANKNCFHGSIWRQKGRVWGTNVGILLFAVHISAFLVETKICLHIPSHRTIHAQFYQLQDYQIRSSHTFWLTFHKFFSKFFFFPDITFLFWCYIYIYIYIYISTKKHNENFKYFESHSILMCYMKVESVQKYVWNSIPWNSGTGSKCSETIFPYNIQENLKLLLLLLLLQVFKSNFYLYFIMIRAFKCFWTVAILEQIQ
jgi:hypothetical protein